LLLSIWLSLASIEAFAQPVSIANDADMAKLPPTEIYGALPDASEVTLSPDGRRLAMITPRNGRNVFVIVDLEAKNKSIAVSTDEYEPVWIKWKSNNRLIAAVRNDLQESVTKPRIENAKLITIDADDGAVKDLVRDHLAKIFIVSTGSLISLLPRDNDHVLVALYGYKPYRLTQKIKPELFRIDINTGSQERVDPQEEGGGSGWVVDQEGNVRLRKSGDGRTHFFQYRSAVDKSWQTFMTLEKDRDTVFSPLKFVEGYADRIYVLSNHEGGENGLYEYDLSSKRFVRTLAPGQQDTFMVIDGDRLVGYQGMNGSPVYLAADYAQQSKAINTVLPESRNEIVDICADGKLALVRVIKGNEPVTYWLVDWRGGEGRISPLVVTYPGLTPSQIAPTWTVRYKARDGLEVEALLTLPPGIKSEPANAPLPFVVLPHGGPTGCNGSGFDYRVQFLASRGYGVFQPQFRGSCGYGKEFKKAGQQQWGLSMQDDVTDGTLWLVQQHIADPARIAIVGFTGYGGYAALMGAIKGESIYRCLVAISPIADLELLSINRHDFLYSDANMPKQDIDRKLMGEISPVQNAAHIGIPALFIHGRKDYTVPAEHTERMVEAMQKAGKTAEVLYLDEADHDLSHGGDRLATLKALEKFLATHIPVK
jgi:dipeptidyl aminopeptidase/acylaminoacyl peptidase